MSKSASQTPTPAPTNPPLTKEIVADVRQFDTRAWLKTVQGLTKEELPNLRECLIASLQNLKNLFEELRTHFQDKDEIIELMVISAMAQEPMLMFGPPGTAKSELVTRFAEGLGVRRPAALGWDGENSGSPAVENWKVYFEYLLNQYTEPDELLGPVLINQLLDPDAPRFARARRGMIPDASVVFMDEVFRGSSAILNALLSLINERRVYEAGQPVKARTMIFFGAANRPPVGDELAAFYERFPVRVVSRSIPPNYHVSPAPGAVQTLTPEQAREKRYESRLSLLEKGWKLERLKMQSMYEAPSGQGATPLPQRACLSDIVLCNRYVMEVIFGPEQTQNPQMKAFMLNYADTVDTLNHDARRLCTIDDRKYVKLFKIILASAFYHHGAELLNLTKPVLPQLEDMGILKHTWSDMEMDDALDQAIRLHIDRLAPKGRV